MHAQWLDCGEDSGRGERVAREEEQDVAAALARSPQCVVVPSVARGIRLARKAGARAGSLGQPLRAYVSLSSGRNGLRMVTAPSICSPLCMSSDHTTSHFAWTAEARIIES